MRKVMLAILVAVLIGALTAPADAKGEKGPDPRHWTVHASGDCTGHDSASQYLFLNPIKGASAPMVEKLTAGSGFDAWDWTVPAGWTDAGSGEQNTETVEQYTSSSSRPIKGGRESVATASVLNGQVRCTTVVDRKRHSIGVAGPYSGIYVTLGRHPHLDLIDYAAKKGRSYRMELIVRAAGHKHDYRLRATAARTGVVAWKWGHVPGLRKIRSAALLLAHTGGYVTASFSRLKHPLTIPAAPKPIPQGTPDPLPTTSPTPTPPVKTTQPCPLICL